MRGLTPAGDVIRDRRKVLGWTQVQLAIHVRCDSRTVRNAEQGKRIDGNTLSAIALAMDLTLPEISVSEENQQQRHIEIVREWDEAFCEADIPCLLAFHHPETVLELPGAETIPGIPETASFKGLDALREHFIQTFSMFSLVEVLEQQLDAIGDKVFHRSTATLRGNETGREVIMKFYNEFEFCDGLIIHRVTISDLGGHRHVLGMD